MFTKEQCYLIKKSLCKIDNQSLPQRNKKFIELLQQQNQNNNLVEKSKSKTTIIQMLIEIQDHVDKIDLESNLTQKFESVTRKSNRNPSIHNTYELKCSNKYETLYRDDNDDESCNSCNSSTTSDSSTSSKG